MAADRIKALREHVAQDRRTAEADERHWSDIPEELFTARRALAEADAKTRILNMIERWTHPTPELRLVANELLDAMEAVYATPEPTAFITTDGSDRYHTSIDCPAFKAGRASGDERFPVVPLTAAEAAQARQTECPVCVRTIPADPAEEG